MVIRATSRASYLMPAGLPLPAFDSRCDNRWADTPGDSVFRDCNEGEFAFRWSSVKWTGWDLNPRPDLGEQGRRSAQPPVASLPRRIRAVPQFEEGLSETLRLQPLRRREVVRSR